MDREQVLSILSQHREVLRQRFGVKHLALFGSAARDQLHDGSDIDLLVEFEGPPTFDGYLNLKDYLEALFGTTVDLATDEMLKPRLRRCIEKDLIRVACPGAAARRHPGYLSFGRANHCPGVGQSMCA